MNDEVDKAFALLSGKYCEKCEYFHETTNFGTNMNSVKFNGREFLQKIYICGKTKETVSKYKVCDNWKENPFEIQYIINFQSKSLRKI